VKNNAVIAFLDKYKTFILASAIALVLFRNYIFMIVSFILFAALGWWTMKISRMVPHISAETVTATSILMGYIWGWPVGLCFGLLVGFSGYVNASQMNMTTIICSFLMGLSGVLGSLFHTFGFPFWIAFVATYFIRANLSFFLISMVNPDKMENIMHSYVESLFNVAVVLQFLQIIYGILIKFIN
jgi:hypothetical protein